MSVSDEYYTERRLSTNGRNAYLTVNAEENNKKTTKNRNDDILFLTGKPVYRARSCSPALFTRSVNSDNSSMPSVLINNTDNNKTLCANEDKTLISPSTNTMSPTTGAIKKNVQKEKSAAKPQTQVGIDRYITVLKRGRSPNSAKIASMPKVSKEMDSVISHNRFALLGNDSDEHLTTNKTSKPPPIYLREQNSNDLVKKLISLLGENSFYIVPIKRGNIYETKIQVNHENDYRKIVTEFEACKKNFYTYQLKSSKGLQIVIKGIDSCVDPEDVKNYLLNKGFKIKNVINIRNREKLPQPMFRVELEPGDIKLKKGEVHPIYDLRYVLHRKITVEEPHKRSGPVQCLNCQEYGHTRAYCKLPPVCVVCGELHKLAECDKSKDDVSAKKCSNCNGNHTANYRGCPVYSHIKRSITHKTTAPVTQSQNRLSNNYHQIPQAAHPQGTYANVLRTNPNPAQNQISLPSADDNPAFNLSRLEATIETLVQTVNNFTNSMSSMMQEMLKMQSMLLQAVLNKP